MSYVNKLGDYKPFKVMRIIKSVSKQFSWNNCSKILLSSVATVFYANIAVDLALYLCLEGWTNSTVLGELYGIYDDNLVEKIKQYN